MGRLCYPRRQQLRRLKRASGASAAAAITFLLAVLAALAGQVAGAAVLMILTVAIGVYARQWAHLAARARVGARSESEVRRALSALELEGWRVCHSLRWQGHGDIDHVAIAPTGMAFAIETKTHRYHEGHLASVRSQAAWLERRRRRWCPRGALPVLCVTRGSRLEHLQDEVLVVSVHQLVGELRTTAASVRRPAFLGLIGSPT